MLNEIDGVPFSILSRATFKAMEIELLRREAAFNSLMAERDRYHDALRDIADSDIHDGSPLVIARTALGDPRA